MHLRFAELVAINLEFTSRLARGANYRRTVKLPAIFPSSRRSSPSRISLAQRAYLITRRCTCIVSNDRGTNSRRATGIAIARRPRVRGCTNRGNYEDDAKYETPSSSFVRPWPINWAPMMAASTFHPLLVRIGPRSSDRFSWMLLCSFAFLLWRSWYVIIARYAWYVRA